MKSALRAALLFFLAAAGAFGQEGIPTGVQVGASLPALSGVDLQGKPVTLSKYPERVTVVLSFWSIHCTDCIRELDDLRLIRREFTQEQVAVVAVNTDSGLPVARIADFVRRYEVARGSSLDVIHLLDRNGAILEKLGVRYIPLLVVADNTGRVRSVVSGYSPEDRERVARAVEEGRVALGGWGEGFRARVRTLLRAPASERPLEWGSFRVEEGMSLFGLYDARGWLADAAGRRDRGAEARRVETVVADRVKVSVLRAALASVGIRLPPPAMSPFLARGVEVPESLFATDTRWKRLYSTLGFDQLFKEEVRSFLWVGDDYRLGVVADVDLGALRSKLEAAGFPEKPARIRVEAVSDYDFKSRAVFDAFQRLSYRVQAVEGQEIVYFGDAAQAVEEFRAVDIGSLRIFVEAPAANLVRIEVL